MSAAIQKANAANHFSAPGSGRSEAILGTSLRYKAEAPQTGGQLVCAEITVPPGQGIPPHRHSEEDESFYVLEGSIAVDGDDCGGNGIRLDAGGFFYGPRGRVHGFRCVGEDRAKLLVFITPGTSIGKMFAELAELTWQQGDTANPAAIAELCGHYGIAFERA